MDRFTVLRSFCAVVENGGFAAAARALGLSNAAVSKHVSELEADLGVRLLGRTTRQVNATDAGESYYRRVSSLLADLSEANEQARRETAAPRGPLRIAAPMSLGITTLAPLVAQFMARYPDLEPVLDLDDAPSDVIGGRYDVVIRARRELTDSSLIARKLAPLEHVICGAPAYFQQAGTPVSPQDLTAHRALLYTHAASPERWRLSAASKTVEVTVKPILRSNNSLAIREALVGGAGLALIPRIYVEDALKRGDLMQVLGEWHSAEMAIYALLPGGRNLPARSRAFVGFLAEAMQQRQSG